MGARSTSWAISPMRNTQSYLPYSLPPNSQEVGSLGIPGFRLRWEGFCTYLLCGPRLTLLLLPVPPPFPLTPSCLRKRGKRAKERWPFRSCSRREIICKSYGPGQPGASLRWRLPSASVHNPDVVCSLRLIGLPSLRVLSHPSNGTRAAEIAMATTCIQQIFIELLRARRCRRHK